ncbi:gamma-glutamylcyclotransferase [Myxosarcina sp. GI1]|uniref:allophanate hydrolase-related protein n=1 Tax=Myxosarcina sp. GI1 TaxID=1541065 RepID=UPI00055F4CB5|nr:gamma-glutamylcyclotransferase [Myxosarcina sp. GI1]
MTTKKSGIERVFICGSALRGQPDHQNLQAAKFIRTTKTLPQYRLHAAENGWHPAIYEVESGGISIPGEIYELTEEQYEYLLANEPPHMYPDVVNLEADEKAIAMLYPQELVKKYQWPDISDFGGWAAYKQATSNEQ